MKMTVCKGGVAATLAVMALGGVANAQEAVTNVDDIGIMITKSAWQAANIAKMAAQVEQEINAVNQLKAEYSALTGSRNLGEIFNNPALAQFVPNQWQGLYNGIKSGNLASITSALTSVQKDQNSGTYSQMTADVWNRQQQAPGVDEGLAQQAYQANIQRMQDIQSLLAQINVTQDPKAAADLGNRIAAEQAMIENEQAKLNLVSMMEKAEQEAQDAKARQAWSNTMTAPDEMPSLPANLQAQSQ